MRYLLIFRAISAGIKVARHQTIRFTPAAIGGYKGSVVDADDSATSPNQVVLSGGSGVAPVTISPISGRVRQPVNQHAEQSADSYSDQQSERAAELQFNPDRLLNFHRSNTCGSGIPGNSSCTVTVVFTLKALGLLREVVKLTDDASNSPQAIPLSGNGVAATPTPNPTPTSTSTPPPTPTSTTTPTPTLLLPRAR
jgi:hypothetical protein